MLICTCTHGSNNRVGMARATDRNDGDVGQHSPNYFDSTNAWSGIPRLQINDHNFGTLVPDLVHDGIWCVRGEPHLAVYDLYHIRLLNALLQDDPPLWIFRQNRDWDKKASRVGGALTPAVEPSQGVAGAHRPNGNQVLFSVAQEDVSAVCRKSPHTACRITLI